MGIDVYLDWDGRTEKEANAQMTGFSVYSGDVGYLREAYHGAPYATQLLIPEGWEEDAHEGVAIHAEVLKERLPVVMEAARMRSKEIYKEDPPDEKAVQAFVDFVELAERKEKETGKPCRIIVSY